MIKEILELANDENFYQLQNSKLNIFDVLKIQGKEEPISAVLAWMLDPRANHGLEDAFLLKFIQDGFKNNSALMVKLLTFEPTSTMVTTEYVLPSGRRIDIMIRDFKNNIAIGIENKIYSSENNEQTLDYEKDFKKLFSNGTYGLIYVVINEADYPRSDRFVRMTHRQIIDIIASLTRINKSINNEATFLIEQYVRSVKNSMGLSEEQELCLTLYKKYPSAVSLLTKTISNMLDELPEKLFSKIIEIINVDKKFLYTGGKTWLAVYPEEWVTEFGREKWSNVHHEFYYNDAKLFLTFHVEGKEYSRMIEKRYKGIEICSFTIDNIDSAAQEGYKELVNKHSEIAEYIKTFYKK